VKLPDNVQSSIERAIAKRADSSASQADLQKARIDAQTNEARQQGYNACPTCAQIDIMRELPRGLTTYAPGGAFAVGPSR
jgi:hypothetical protein